MLAHAPSMKTTMKIDSLDITQDIFFLFLIALCSERSQVEQFLEQEN